MRDTKDRDTERIYRAVDQAALDHCSQPSRQRLILARLPRHHHLFRVVSCSPCLTDEAIDNHQHAFSTDAFRENVCPLVQPSYLQRLACFVEAFDVAQSNGRGVDDLGCIADAAFAGQIESLLIEDSQLIPGHFDTVSGEIAIGDPSNLEVDDILDDLNGCFLGSSREQIIVSTQRMPTQTCAVAKHCF